MGWGSALFVVPKSALTENSCPHPLPRHRYVRMVSILRTGPVRTQVPQICTTVPTSAEEMEESVGLQNCTCGGR